MYLGIDPSQRHTGLCLLNGTEPPVFGEIKTGDEDVLTSLKTIRVELREFLRLNRASQAVFCQEKQLSVGGHSSPLMFCVQMNVLEILKESQCRPRLVMPLPGQLKSYVRKVIGYNGPDGAQYVKHFQRTQNHPGRISIHKVDAYYLARLGRDVVEGRFRYNLTTAEASLFPWSLINGDQR